MKLYLISQNANKDYDTYDSVVVAAESEEEARFIHPDSDYKYSKMEHGWFSCDGICDNDEWALPEHVNVELIGETDQYSEPCVICSSFNAG